MTAQSPASVFESERNRPRFGLWEELSYNNVHGFTSELFGRIMQGFRLVVLFLDIGTWKFKRITSQMVSDLQDSARSALDRGNSEFISNLNQMHSKHRLTRLFLFVSVEKL